MHSPCVGCVFGILGWMYDKDCRFPFTSLLSQYTVYMYLLASTSELLGWFLSVSSVLTWSSQFQPLAMSWAEPYMKKVLDHLDLWLVGYSWLCSQLRFTRLWHIQIYSTVTHLDLLGLIPCEALDLACNLTALHNIPNLTQISTYFVIVHK